MHRASQATHEKHYGGGSWGQYVRDLATGGADSTLKKAGKK